jgi:hypothetical protein
MSGSPFEHLSELAHPRFLNWWKQDNVLIELFGQVYFFRKLPVKPALRQVAGKPTIRSIGLQPRIIAEAADAGLFRALISSISNFLQDFAGRLNTAKDVQNGPITGEGMRVEVFCGAQRLAYIVRGDAGIPGGE